ncbi:MAG: aminotransferase class V-fold PLP-dependent enzyme [Ignavibacteriales bacterium]|nr:aminotransferase class V-fold PLP-dependent enzyme [Ignavibacteriales bacterium]
MIYLNNAATSFPKPVSVLNAVERAMREAPSTSARSGGEISSSAIIVRCRELLAKLFLASHSDQIILTSGATESLNLVIRGLPLQGTHVITTAIEHNSVLRPLRRLEASGAIVLSIVDCDGSGNIDPDLVRNALRANTSLIAVNHCSNVTGAVVDVEAIAEIAREANAFFLVDASQSAGRVPIDVTAMGADAVVFAGHKSLYGISGTGGLYLKKPFSLEPLKVGGTGQWSESPVQPKIMPMYYEAGTPNSVGIAALFAGVEFVSSTGVEAIHANENTIVRHIVAALSTMSNVVIYGNGLADVSIFAMNVGGYDPDDVAFLLHESSGIVTRSGLHCAPLIHRFIGTSSKGCLRISPSFFTSREQADIFIDAVSVISRSAGKRP